MFFSFSPFSQLVSFVGTVARVAIAISEAITGVTVLVGTFYQEYFNK